MEKKNVVIYVAGQRFSICTSDSQEYVLGIGEKVDVMIKGIQKDNPRLNRDACAILAALSLCDDESKLRDMMEVLRTQVKDYLETNEKLREENEELKAKIKELSENTCTASEETTAETAEDKAEESTAAVSSAVMSRAEALVMAEAKEAPARQTAFVGKDFRHGKKNKKNKNHANNRNFENSKPAPVAVSTRTQTEVSEEEVSPYHQFSIFDTLE